MLEEYEVMVWREDSIDITYDATVHKGKLEITAWRPMSVRGGQQRLTNITVKRSERNTITVPVEGGYRHDTWVKHKSFAGVYDISWKVK